MDSHVPKFQTHSFVQWTTFSTIQWVYKLFYENTKTWNIDLLRNFIIRQIVKNVLGID